ncbi:MAG: [FeFe] hydrogenase H-cluster radical SAM maturase HydG [bacterium]|nr:[FeFe] hydrogenase H-cluster radical SAM maturase HydG [bacterium]
MMIPTTVPIDGDRIWSMIENTDKVDDGEVREVLAAAREMKGLSSRQAAVLCGISDPELLSELFTTAREVKEAIYGQRLVIFSPLYVSNLCANDCAYCSFRATNRSIKRRALDQDEIRHEAEMLIEQGHKRVLLVAGESYPREGFDYVLKAIDSVYAAKVGAGEIRRINVNVAPLSVDEFRQLGDHRIGTYQIFQETYHRDTYVRVHLRGKKTDYDWRISAIDRAFAAGIDDVGIGVLFGLADWRYELLAMLQHIRHLENHHGIGPHTISVPRLEPAEGADLASHPPQPVSDLDFRKIVAVLRLTVPYTGIIMSTRETAEIRRETFALGVSQISAGSRTNPGGYAKGEAEDEGTQFSLGDHRSLDEVIRDVAELGYIPSFCTGCYRLGRTGADFMDLAKPGAIRHHCDPNALSTFTEYLCDYGSEGTKQAGEVCINSVLAKMEGSVRARAEEMIRKVRDGQRDVFC